MPSLADLLTVMDDPSNELLAAFFPPSIFNVQTPLAICIDPISAIVQYQIFSACPPVALSFFADNQYVPNRFCTDHTHNALVQARMIQRLMGFEFPIDVKPSHNFLISTALHPCDRSTNVSTPVTWANVAANRLIHFFANGGCNSQGQLSERDYGQQFQHYTSHPPVNPPRLAPKQLAFPLRWQPLTVALDHRRLFGSQQHVIPQIATHANPLVLSRAQF